MDSAFNLLAAATNQTIRVLVVDDCHDNADALAAVIRTFGMEPRVAYSATEAVASLDDFRPMSVVLDIAMPGMDGLKLAAQIRRANPGLTLIAHTGYASEEVRRMAMEAGCDYVFTKPMDLSVFRNILMQLVQPPLNPSSRNADPETSQ